MDPKDVEEVDFSKFTAKDWAELAEREAVETSANKKRQQEELKKRTEEEEIARKLAADEAIAQRIRDDKAQYETMRGTFIGRDYDPNLSLSINHLELFLKLREINLPLIGNNFHILLANILDDRNLPDNGEATFLRLIQGTHNFNNARLSFRLPGESTLTTIRGNRESIIEGGEDIQAFVDTIIAIQEYIDEHEIDNAQVRALRSYINCLQGLLIKDGRNQPPISKCNKFFKFITRRHKRKGGTKRKRKTKRFTRV
jgi:hypothetical protein